MEIDLDSVKTVLEEHSFNVEVTPDPDSEELRQAISTFIEQHGGDPVHHKNNRLLVYFAGHGHTLTTAWGDSIGYLVPADAPLPEQDPAGFQARALSMQEVESYAIRMQAKHALFVFDACFAGTIFRTRSRSGLDPPRSIAGRAILPVRLFITSGSANETVPDDSFFRRQFVAALRGEADTHPDGYVTGSELGEYLYRTVVDYSRKTTHPQYGKIRNPLLDKGDFIFELPEHRRSKPSPPMPDDIVDVIENPDAERNIALEAKRLMERMKARASDEAQSLQAWEVGLKHEAMGDSAYALGTLAGHRAAAAAYRNAESSFDSAVEYVRHRSAVPIEVMSTLGPALKDMLRERNRDIRALREVWPALTNNDAEDLLVVLDNSIIDVSLTWGDAWEFTGDTVTTNVLLEIDFQNRRHERSRLKHAYTWTLERREGRWIIVNYTVRERDLEKM